MVNFLQNASLKAGAPEITHDRSEIRSDTSVIVDRRCSYTFNTFRIVVYQDEWNDDKSNDNTYCSGYNTMDYIEHASEPIMSIEFFVIFERAYL